MQTTDHPLLSRKDVALLTGGKITVRQIRRNERRWGLDKARLTIRTRMVLYRQPAVVLILRAWGLTG